ncbi:hypothetical protein F5B19DRAFT_153271 [Rostrohypoxylon terebratum]|nr:hypothetical protein F5B19DRAFT_153271 [Rostrohypoxylon terebratum]
MTDPISLALGVVPLCITAIGISCQLSSKIKLLRHYQKEIGHIRMKLKIQQELFLDQIELILLKILDERTVLDMIRDQTHPQWQVSSLEEKIKSYLGSRYDRFEEALKEATTAIESILKKISTFAELEDKVPLTKSARDAFRIAFKKQDYLESIEALKDSIAEIKSIRETTNEIQSSHVATNLLPLPTGYEIVRSMSSSLYDLLQNGASCDTNNDARHNLKLLLNSTDETDPNLNMFFEHKLLFQWTLLPICASCRDLAHNDTRHSPKRLRKGHTNYYSTILHPNDKGKQVGEDLAKTGLKCGNLAVRCKTFSESSPPESIGFLDIRNKQRLILYPGLQGLKVDPDTHRCAPTALVDYLRFPVYEVVSDTARIKLGITLVKSMLKYISTPWWPQGFILSEVYIFRGEGEDISSHLDTLHLVKDTPSATGNCSPSFISLESIQDAMRNFGIRNIALYSLGVALLQIGLWNNVRWDDHVLVRQKAEHLPCFGKRYRKVVSKLIWCDFSHGEDLNNPKLLSAIFNEIIIELDSLLRILSIT